MKKHNALKVVLVSLVLFLILSWIIPAAYYSGQFMDQGRVQMGLFDFLHKGRVDEAAPAVPTEPINQPQITPSTEFTMQVEDVFTITGRGTVVTGRIQYGTIQVGEKVYINKENWKNAGLFR